MSGQPIFIGYEWRQSLQFDAAVVPTIAIGIDVGTPGEDVVTIDAHIGDFTQRIGVVGPVGNVSRFVLL